MKQFKIYICKNLNRLNRCQIQKGEQENAPDDRLCVPCWQDEKTSQQVGTEDEINGAYLKDIREQSSCHIPVIKHRNPAFQRTVARLYEDDSPVPFFP